MRLLFALAHYFQPKPSGFYGSEGADPTRRTAAVATAIASLHQTFGAKQGLLDGQARVAHPANDPEATEVTVVACTAKGLHLVPHLEKAAGGLFTHRPCDRDPKFLGLECRAALADGIGRYDWFGYLEDDLMLLDPLFFHKLAWFRQVAGADAVLQPNRYEVAVGQPLHKVYIDGNMADASQSPKFQNVADRPVVEGEAFGRRYVFKRVNNPHSGTFFLDAQQMAHFVKQPDFQAEESGFAGPVESCATLGIMRHFRVYKPARVNAGFLEVRHLNNRYLGARMKFKGGWPLKF
jgi:hypothetical protein